jgi:hypothetical protein
MTTTTAKQMAGIDGGWVFFCQVHGSGSDGGGTRELAMQWAKDVAVSAARPPRRLQVLAAAAVVVKLFTGSLVQRRWPGSHSAADSIGGLDARNHEKW